MEQSKYDLIKRLLPIWTIDLENGTIRTVRGESRRKNSKGYLELHVHHEGNHYYILIHHIIAVAGGLDCVGKAIDHIDGCKLNNRLDNLEAVDVMENSLRAITQGQAPTYQNAKLNGNAAIIIKTLMKYELLPDCKIAEMFNVSKTCIRDIKHGSTWKDYEPMNLDSITKSHCGKHLHIR